MAKDPETRTLSLEVTARKELVTLAGVVRTPQMRAAMEVVAERVPDVTSVSCEEVVTVSLSPPAA